MRQGPKSDRVVGGFRCADRRMHSASYSHIQVAHCSCTAFVTFRLRNADHFETNRPDLVLPDRELDRQYERICEAIGPYRSARQSHRHTTGHA
eukprot:1678753-Rhodomonas_salina.2